MLAAQSLLSTALAFVVAGNACVHGDEFRPRWPKGSEPRGEKSGDEPQRPVARLQPLSVKFMLRGYCHAASSAPDPKVSRGFATSGNCAQKLEIDTTDVRAGLGLIAQPDVPTDFAGTRGMRLLLVNVTDKPATFAACDSRLSIVQEARDATGKWKPIEYLPRSWCGNSYHRLTLGAGEYWSFAAARYDGPFKTKLRFKLEGSESPMMVSNEFKGGIHLEQFSVLQPYSPKNIMDPYFDIAPASTR